MNICLIRDAVTRKQDGAAVKMSIKLWFVKLMNFFKQTNKEPSIMTNIKVGTITNPDWDKIVTGGHFYEATKYIGEI